MKGGENMKVWLCINLQDGERRLLRETEAFDLDKRLWMLKDWTCTEAGDRKATKKYADPQILTGIEFAPIINKCVACESYHFGDDRVCKRQKHIRYDEMEV
jgi:hypothetical protein